MEGDNNECIPYSILGSLDNLKEEHLSQFFLPFSCMYPIPSSKCSSQQNLQAVLEKAQDTLGRQNLGTVGLEAAKVQLSELVSKVSTKCLNSAFSGMKDVSGFCPQQTQSNQPTDCSLDSCLTSIGGSQRDQETEFRWCKDLKENRKSLSPIVNDSKKAFDVEVHASDLSMSVGVQGGNWNGNSSYTDKVFKKRNADVNFLDQTAKRRDSIKPENENIFEGFQLSCFAPKLDLNIHDENDAASRCKQFDLNGFSWC